MADFSLDLNEDQLQIQKWVHDFAEDVVRPAAHEWDEREETPWPIIEEAAKIGLYSLRLRAPTRSPTPPASRWPIVMEELFWGDAGIGLAIFGTAPRASPASSPTARPSRSCEWVPQCFGTPDEDRSSARSA